MADEEAVLKPELSEADKARREHERTVQLATYLAPLNRDAPYPQAELYRAIRKIKQEHPDDDTFVMSMDIEIHVTRLGWIKRVATGMYLARFPVDGRRLSLPPPPPGEVK
jgi:hypothetical protein